MIVDRKKKNSSKTPAHHKKKSSKVVRLSSVGFNDLEDKENQNIFMAPKQSHQLYQQKQSMLRKREEGSESDEYYKAVIPNHYYNNEYNPQNENEEGETKTQNTHDFRKREDFALDDVNFNFSAEKPVNNFTRFELYPDEKEEDRVSDPDSNEVSFEISRRTNKQNKQVNR